MRKLIFLMSCMLFVSVGFIFAQGGTITGVVTSAEDGERLPGVSVSVKGTTIGVITDNRGSYSIAVPSNAKTLVFNYLGMAQQEVAIAGTVMNVQLRPALIDIDEVVVTAYGTRKVESLTGSVDVVGSRQLEKLPVASFENALQGAVSGVNVINSSGMPGSQASIRIRGVGSISAGSEPLYILDGIEVSASDFSSLNPNDIESISVLKDASATALYGSRAANGVIILTSKTGGNFENAEISYRGFYGISRIARDKFDQMNTTELLDYQEYLGMRTPGSYDRAALEKYNTNWLNELTQNGKIQSHDLSIRGGNEKMKYFISGGFYDEEGLIPTSGFQRFTTKLNVEGDANKWLKIGSNLTFGYETASNAITPDRDDAYTNNVYNPIFRSILEKPWVPARREDGSYTQVSDGLNWANPLEHLYLNPSQFDVMKMVASLRAEIKLTKELHFHTITGVDFRDFTSNSYTSPLSAWGLTNKGSVSRGFSRNYKITNTNMFQYNKEMGDHYLEAKLGQESLMNTFSSFSATGNGLPNSLVDVLDATATPFSVAGDQSAYRMLSGFISANYNFDERYHLDASLRYDGASRFGANNRFAPFWSVAGMWDMKKEAFMQDLDIFEKIRYKLSYGTTGNWNIGNYTHLALYGAGPTYNDKSGGAPSVPGNPNLTWESKHMFNTGFDITLPNNVDISLAYYNSNTRDMLYAVPLSYTSGFGEGYSNIGRVVNSGVEFSIDWDVIRTDDWRWSLNANLGYNKNEIKELFAGKTEILDGDLIYKVGESLGTFHLNRLVGVNPANGQYVWLDANGNPTTDFKTSDAVTLSGKTWYAPWNGGLTSRLDYQGFTLTAFFSMMADRWMINNSRYFTENAGFASYNQSKKVLNHWKQVGDIAQFPDPLTETPEFDDHLLEDASFIRLKDLTLNYSFSERSLRSVEFLKKVSFYAKATNLFTMTKYSGQDPEIDSPYDLGYYPHVRSFAFGVEIGF